MPGNLEETPNSAHDSRDPYKFQTGSGPTETVSTNHPEVLEPRSVSVAFAELLR